MKNSVVLYNVSTMLNRLFSTITPIKYILTLVALLSITTNAWAADCAYEYDRTIDNTSIKNSGDIIAQFEFVNVYGLSSISYTLTLQCSAAGKDLQYKVQYLPSNSDTWTDTNISTSTLNGTWQAWRAESSESKTEAISNSSPMYNARGIRIVSNTKFGSKRTVSVSEVKFVMAKTLSGSTETMDFGEQMCETTSAAKIRTFAFTNDETVKISNTNSEEFDATLSKTTDCVGSATITVTFTPKYKGKRTGTITITGAAGSKSFTVEGIGVGKAEPEFIANFQQTVADNLLVDGNINNAFTFVNVSSDDKFTYSIDVLNISSVAKGDQVISYDVSTNRIIAHNAGVATLQFHQKETEDFSDAFSIVYTFTVSKYANGLRCTGDTWTKKMTFDQTIETVFTANNTNSTTPIQIAQTDGDTIAQYVSGSVNSFHNEGTATWKVWQEEDYKYEAAEEKILTVNVGTENTTCYIINEPNEYVLGKGLDPIENGTPFSLNAQKGDKLYFDGRKTNGAVSYFFIQYSTDGGANYSDMRKQDLEPEWKTYGPYDIPEKTTHIRFVTKTGATLQKYYKNIKVTRAQWFDIEDKDGNAITSLTMPTNTIGGNATTADFYIDYSTCADEIKLHSSHPHITFGETGSTTMQFDSNGSGKQKITLTYSADEPEQISATITIYTPYEHKTITITAKTEKEQQELIWSDGFKGNPITIPLMSLMIDSAAVASSGLPVTYSTNNESVIKIADDNKSFEIIAEGTATLTAEQKGDERFLAVSDTKTINVVDKKIQYIIWGQDFTHGLNVGEEVTFDARAYTADVKNNAFTFDDARSALIQYTCPADNGVISIVDGKMTIIGYGKTAITASLAGDENHFEATPVIKTVHIREINDGECENIPVYDSDEEITFFAFNLEMPEIVNDIKLDPSNGVPDKLNFYVRGESYNVAIQYYNGGIDVYESTDGGNTWSDKLGEVWPEKNTTLYSDSIQLSPNATHIRLKRPKGGRGYHFVGGLVVSRKQFIEVEKEIINLGNVAAGAVRKGVIRFNYSDVKQDLQVTKANDSQINKLELDKTTIEVDCGATDKDSIAFVFRPMEIGNWSNMVTINDPKTGKSKTVTLTATVTIGEQQIIWNPETNIQQSTPPQLNAVTTSGLPVTYEVTSGTDVASIVDGQVIINKIGTFTITVKAPASSSFNPAELSVTFKVSEETVFIFESDGEWSNEDNWNKKTLPTENDAVIINANVAISEEATIKSMTINDEMKVTVKTTGKLTIKENGATGTGGGNLIIEATLGDKNNSGSSGQVVGAEKLNVRDAYFQMSFDPSGKITYGWYDFVVPFEVEILNGIYRQGESTSLRNNIDFIVMQHNEAARAAGTKDWKPYTGTMIPGKVYTITFDEQKEQNTFLFKKKTGAPLEGKNVFKAVCSQQGKTENRGWNGLGNGTLQHKQLMQSGKKVQIYDHTNNIYITKEADEYIFAVGTSFFMQIEANSDIELTEASLNLPLMAPAREGRTIDEFRLALTSNDEEKAADYMWISASEDAQGTYTIGHDLLKMGTPTEAKVAQMWITRENMHLCDVEMQLIDNTAQCTIDFFVPQTKQYTLHVDKAPKDASLYLTYNNQIIWNLTKSPYNMDLTKGTISGYGLILEGNRTPQITTGIEETNANEQDGTRKVLINNQIYLITSDGAIYTMTGTKIQ